MKTIKQQKGTVARKPARIKQEFRRENQPFILNHIFKKKASADDLLPESKVGTPVVNHTTAAQIYQNILKYYFVIYKNNSDKKQGEEGFRYSEISQWLIKEKKEMMNNPIWRKYDGSHIPISSIKAHRRETVEDGYLKDFTNSTLLLAEEA